MFGLVRTASNLCAICVGGVVASLTIAPGFAQTIIDPVILAISETGRGATTLRNNGDKALQFRLVAKAWRQVDGADQYDETSDFVISPVSLTLAPGQERDVRVGFRNPERLATERTYRLVVDETPTKSANTANVMAIVLKINYYLPVFVAPTGEARADLACTGRKDGAALVVRCIDHGNIHASIGAIGVEPQTPDSIPKFVSAMAATVLAGGWKEWRIALPGDAARSHWSECLVKFNGEKMFKRLPLEMP